MDNLIDNLSNLNLNKSIVYSNILYYELTFSDKENEGYKTILNMVLDKLNITDSYNKEKNTVEHNGNTFKVNSEFHITMLYTGGKDHEKNETMYQHIDKKYNVVIHRIGVNDKFICLGVDFKEMDSYYGNEVKHITFGLNKSKKGVYPKDSYTALLDGNNENHHIIKLEEPIIVEATFKAHLKN
jgi:hypothetical protein